MRTFAIGGIVALVAAAVALVISLSAFGGSSDSSTSDQTLQRQSDLWEIDQVEKKFHRATSQKNIVLMMSLYAKNATFTAPGMTLVGRGEIREFWRTSKAFTNNWISDTPAYKVRITVNGDRGTLYFECHYIDWATGVSQSVTAADVDVARIGGRWLITSFAGASATLTP